MHELTNHSIKVNSSGGHKVNSKSSPFPVSNLVKNTQTNPFGHFQKSKLSNNSRLITMCQTTKKSDALEIQILTRNVKTNASSKQRKIMT